MPKSTRTVDVTNNGTTTQVPLIVDKNAQNEEAIGRALVHNGELVSSTNKLPVDVAFPSTQPITATALPLPAGAATETTLSTLNSRLPASLVSGRLSVDGSAVTQPVSLATPLPAGTNAIGSISVSNFPATQPITATTLPLPTGAATAARQPGFGVAGTPNADVTSIQGVTGMTPVTVAQQSNAATTSVTFTAAVTSSSFTIANRLAIIVVPPIATTPTLTLQVSLDAGTTWASSSVTVSTDATNAKLVESDILARVSGAFGLANAFRFVSTASITATLAVRSIVQ